MVYVELKDYLYIPLSMQINCCASLQFNIRVFLLCRFDGDIFTRSLEASIERNMWGGKGPQRTRYIDYCTWAYALRFRQEFFRHPSSETFFFFFGLRTSFLLSFQPQTLFFHIFRHTRYAKRTQAKTWWE